MPLADEIVSLQELRGKILQYIIVPAFEYSFEHGGTEAAEKLIGSPPAPDQDVAENVVSTFILDIIDPQVPQTEYVYFLHFTLSKKFG